MSDIQLYLLEVDKNKAEAKRIASQSATKLQSKELKLIDLITSLEEYINNKDDGNQRAKSVAYLADVLENVPQKVLSGQERRLLCDFILGRIEGDNEGIGSSARALIALEDRGRWDPATASQVADTFLDHATPLKDFKLQTDRFQVIQLFDRLVEKYRAPLKDLHDASPEFMSKFIFFFDGEKDPRNLMIVFSILQVPMTEWDISASAQDLFDAVFNYFPITFKPPPDDPYGITAQDLKDRLRDCIAANSEFAPYAFPALLDKLDSTSMNTKRDVLDAMQACVNKYEVRTINLYSVTLWDALKFEILNVQEEDLAAGALKTLSLVAGKFALQEGPLNAYLKPIIKECNEHLEDAPTKQSAAAGRILHSLATAATPVADKVVKSIFPTLLTLYQSSESLTKRRGLLEVFNQVLLAYIERSRLQPQLNIEAVSAFGSDALGVMLRALSNAPKAEVSFRLTALSGVSQLLALRGLLTSEQAYQVVNAVADMILHEQGQGNVDIRSEAVKALTEMAHSAPEAVRNNAIPAFMAELPDSPTDDSGFVPVLEALAQLSKEQQIFDTVVLRLKNKYNAARAQNASPRYQYSILLAILYAFTNGSPMPDEEGVLRNDYFAEYVEPFLSTLLDSSGEKQDKMVVDVIGRISNAILRPQGVHIQSQVYNKNLEALAAARTSSQAHFEAFLLHYYAALRPEVIDADDIISLLQTQAALAVSETSGPSVRYTALHQVATIINKFIDPKAMQSTLETAGIEVESLYSHNPTTAVGVGATLGVAICVIQALILQGKCGALVSKYLQLFLRLLPRSDEHVSGKGVALAFGALLAENEFLTKENHCQISRLYKQKTFSQVVPSLTESIRTADPNTKPNYLIALVGILRWLPYSMLESSLSTLIPPLLQTLDLNSTEDQESKKSTLIIFESILMHDPAAVAEHSASLITRLLKCTAQPDNNAQIRAKAVQCLALLPKQLKRELVVPYRRQVVKKLMTSLDDAKREVRAEAVRCRTAWLGLDEEDEDQD